MAVGAVAAVAIAALVTGCGGKSKDHPPSSSAESPTVGKLPQATTFVTLKNVAKDAGALAAADGTVAHPIEAQRGLPCTSVGHAAGRPYAAL